MSNFYEQHKSVQPYLIIDASATIDTEHYQSKEDRAKLDGVWRAEICYVCLVHRGRYSTSTPARAILTKTVHGGLERGLKGATAA